MPERNNHSIFDLTSFNWIKLKAFIYIARCLWDPTTESSPLLHPVLAHFVITKRDSFVYYKVRQVLQSATRLNMLSAENVFQ